ncbi:hypothetical protein H7849_13125 [Alloacidobacterium dinghuense]|uniref:Uncharacterized protein n=1 Tax=Alloacidobacterium dinghuense TaxID=2763107 RepID=A0A7G8BC67_9BACT|nr:hypothetical protein [Alloacidobacterium dinghuense]QNI30137.1 hypothetical protein H7849_13125 [Alloacidobacterium dinghuense]
MLTGVTDIIRAGVDVGVHGGCNAMTINRYGIAATLQTLASQVSATILSHEWQ